MAHVANKTRSALWTGLAVGERVFDGITGGVVFAPIAGKEEKNVLTMRSKDSVFLIHNPMLRNLYETLTAKDVPLQLKQSALRDFEDYMELRERQAKMHFLTELLWLTCGEDLDALKSSFAKKDVKSEDRLSVEDKDSLVRALVFTLGGITEEELSGVIGMLKKFKESDTGSNELPFF